MDKITFVSHIDNLFNDNHDNDKKTILVKNIFSNILTLQDRYDKGEENLKDVLNTSKKILFSILNSFIKEV